MKIFLLVKYIWRSYDKTKREEIGTNYLERAACFLITGFPHHAFHPYHNLLNDGFLLTKGFIGILPKGFFSGTEFVGDFFCDSEDSVMRIYYW